MVAEHAAAELIPAIDLKGGRCVRLRQGRMEDATVFSDDPVTMALHWQQLGARRLHVVDLDGAFAGRPVNGAVIAAICEALDIPVQIGGGIRDAATLQGYLDAGVRWGIIGTRAAREPEWAVELAQAHPGQVIVGIDARKGLVAMEGWAATSELAAVDLARRFEDGGVAGIIYTDIDRDGMLAGINLEETVTLAEAVDLPVYASGGLATMADVERLGAAIARCSGRLAGCISGRALYEGTLDYRMASDLLAGAA
ncbi:MAG: 1-(5-phosphoribosyl)-5-[(5-phosphoribosylamino)methylideneamino]imidazole-4-carboxamide isomerase [Gammaproteobacteria bacterium]|nr:1-(5-phosphoribosyl)-5-[(5-phosphoribosylamino)methylideneamino]imidazole-4-carboxamide isomerase [Gammaproteobacteria bacterium]